uniref:Uncharacterized protein n=1 Tax=Steinernema glaseri TaxID=37863 RepID=A0A1I7ZZ46_9BILA
MIALYGSEESVWKMHSCGRLNSTMDMYRKRGDMYEKSECQIKNLSTLESAPWSDWSDCEKTQQRMVRWKVLQPLKAYDLKGVHRKQLVEVKVCEPPASSGEISTSTSTPTTTTVQKNLTAGNLTSTF